LLKQRDFAAGVGSDVGRASRVERRAHGL
jgi:hypothetical protein